ncbi:MAG TPA: hypothetical protein VHP36_01500 [Chitinispirillaceae bacterium]|nr:hypothetical protein [Chitinispirillaceae bacterium]
MKKIVPLLILFFQLVSFGYEISLPEEEASSSSCKLSMKLVMTTPEADAATGRAIVEVKLINSLGNPLSDYEIQLSSTRGTFLCQLPEQKSENAGDNPEIDRSCFLTGQDGKIKVNLVNLPLNGGAVQVKATCDCGGYQVYASGNINYNKKIIKKTK